MRGKPKFPTYHNPLDTACGAIESEEIVNHSDLDYEIQEDMKWRPLKWLEGHYPELEFGLCTTRIKADFLARYAHKKYIWANWRKK